MDKENSIPCGLTIRCFEFNMIGENCYVVSDETRDCVIIDCGAYWKDEREELVEYITKNELRPVRLLATHGHLDHHLATTRSMTPTAFRRNSRRRMNMYINRFFIRRKSIST